MRGGAGGTQDAQVTLLVAGQDPGVKNRKCVWGGGVRT